MGETHLKMWLSLLFCLFVTLDATSKKENKEVCEPSPAEVIFLLDVTAANKTVFAIQQQRVLRTLRHIESVVASRRFSIVAFHERAVTLLELGSPFSNDTNRLTSLISSLHSRRHVENSVAKAFDAAAEQFEQYGDPSAKKVVLLAHDGINTDFVAETLESAAAIERLGVEVFALSGNPFSNEFALLGYTGDRSRVVINAKDTQNFMEILDEALGVCSATQLHGKTPLQPQKAFGVRAARAQDKKRIFVPGTPCVFDKADVMIVLDTSGSVYSAFEEERQIALDLLKSFPEFAFQERLQVSVVRFAATADIALAFREGRARDEVLTAVQNINFTGQNTRIASAVDLGVEELNRAKRKDARQIFILISDGHGQEYWNVVQKTGKKLQNEGAELFAVSASHDYNRAELLIYVGDESRLFVGPKERMFIPTLSSYIENCVTRGKSEIEGLPEIEEGLLDKGVAIHPPARPTPSGFVFTKKDETKQESTLKEDKNESTATPGSITEPMPPAEVTSQRTSSDETLEEQTDVEDENSDEFRTTILPNNEDVLSEDENDTPLDEEAKSSAEAISPETEDVLSNEEEKENSNEEMDSEVTEVSGLEPEFSGDEEETENENEELAAEENLEENGSGEIEVPATLVVNELNKLRDVTESASGTCDIDIVFIIDRSQSVDADFKKQIEVAQQTVSLFEPTSFASNIRVGAVSFANAAKIEFDLKSASRDEILEEIREIQHTGGSTSAVEGAKLAMKELISNRRSNAKLLILLLTDGQSQDHWRELQKTAKKLQSIPNSVLLSFTASNQFSKQELKAWIKNKNNIFLSDQTQEFLNTVSKNVQSCPTKEGELVEKTEEEESVEKKETLDDERDQEVASTTVSPQNDVTQKGDLVEPEPEVNPEEVKEESEEITTTTTEEPKAHGIKSSGDVEKIGRRMEKVWSAGCLIDLMFIIDVSASVEEGFELQLQLAVDLIKRLPASEFEHRVNVGIVLFNSNATLEMELGAMRKRSSILDTLLSVNNTGGGTSIAAGVDLAFNELERRKRKEARQMIVLVSDGNSQDHWDDVLKYSNKLRTTEADVFAVTVSKIYAIRELTLYAGDKWHVYIDARVRQFLDEVERAIQQCTSPLEAIQKQISAFPRRSLCDSELVDVVIVVDTTSDSEIFYKERQYAIDLVKSIPNSLFEHRLAVSIIQAGAETEVEMQLGSTTSRTDVLYELERLGHSEGNFSLTEAMKETVKELNARHRKSAKTFVLLVSNGDTHDSKDDIHKSTSKLRELNTDVFVISLSDEPNRESLEAIDSSTLHLYAEDRVDDFTTELSAKITACEKERKSAQLAPSVNKNTVSSGPLRELKDTLTKLRKHNDLKRSRNHREKCKYNKIDLQIILDASSSREEVFEKQRELALSLIERLPISPDEAHVAVGINSFTSTPVLRQTLGLGRDKEMVRQVIEGISYNGGSTLTAQAVELSVKDLERGRRPDAVQVVVLMNDGISQDLWSKVLEASQRLADTGAERFGVALGKEVDLRELRHYVGSDERIYRDNSTEKFLDDVVSLLDGSPRCLSEISKTETSKPLSRSNTKEECSKPNLDLLVLFDNTDKTDDMSDTAVNSNRYLLLDVLGSLVNNSNVRVSVISFSDQPKIELDFTNISERDLIFAKVEAIKAIAGRPSYSEAISVGLEMLEKERRADARATLIIVGDGETTDTAQDKATVSRQIQQTPALSCVAVDSSMKIVPETLVSYTGAREKVYDYDRNALFAREIRRMAEVAEDPSCKNGNARERARAAPVLEVDGEFRPTESEQTYKTIGPLKSSGKHNFPQKEEVQRDLVGEPIQTEKLLAGKVIIKKKPSTKAPLPIDIEQTTKEPETSTSPQIRSTRTQRTITTQEVETSTTTERTTSTQRTTEITTSTSPRPLTTPTFVSFFHTRPTASPTDPPTTFQPGCLIDLILIMDSSGSVEETFNREKELAAGIIDKFRIGPNNARVSIIKFAAVQKVRTVYSFKYLQSRTKILKALNHVLFSSGTTALHAAIKQAISEYTVENGARPNQAVPIVIIFTDGYGRKPVKSVANELRSLIPNTYAVAINHEYPISRRELELITGDPSRVYTDANIRELYKEMNKFTKDCILE